MCDWGWGKVNGGGRLTVGTLDNGARGELAGRAQVRFLVELLCESGPSADDHAHGRLLHLQDVVVAHHKALFCSEPFLLLLAPSEGERVRSPPADRRQVHVRVLARVELPRAGHTESYTESITRQDFDVGFRGASADITVDDAGKAGKAFEGPQCDDSNENALLRKALKMDPYSAHGKSGQSDVQMEECLVEGVTDDGGRLEEDR